MSSIGRRSSLLNIDNWLDKCSNEEPDSMIYEADYTDEIAAQRTKTKAPEIEQLYRTVTDVCTKIGLPPDIVDSRLNDIDECISSYLVSIQKDVNDEFEKLCTYRQDLLEKVTKMVADLHLPSYIPDDNITLLQHCKRLRTKFNELNSVREKRMVQLQELRDKQIEHCKTLGIVPPSVKTQTDIPSEDEINKLAAAIVDLNLEEKRRRERYHIMREAILKCMEQVEYIPTTESEKMIIAGTMNLHDSHMSDMSNMHAKLESLYAVLEEKYKKLKERLISLYDRLDIDQNERDDFLKTHSVCKPILMVEMEVEIEKYEEMKRLNIGRFIGKIKEELTLEYERCFISQEEQDNFFSLYDGSNECSEDLLELFEKELERVKKYGESNKEIIEKFHKWRMMWKELIDLEVKANDPNRFNNRGGQLLQEEKKRKTIQKGLPKVEKELTTLSEEYSTKNQGAPFKVFGSSLNDFIAGCWDELNLAKEEEKKERQRAKQTVRASSQTRKPLQPSSLVKRTPSKRPAGAGITPTPSKRERSQTSFRI